MESDLGDLRAEDRGWGFPGAGCLFAEASTGLDFRRPAMRHPVQHGERGAEAYLGCGVRRGKDPTDGCETRRGWCCLALLGMVER